LGPRQRDRINRDMRNGMRVGCSSDVTGYLRRAKFAGLSANELSRSLTSD
jgi:hypothetical protein